MGQRLGGLEADAAEERLQPLGVVAVAGALRRSNEDVALVEDDELLDGRDAIWGTGLQLGSDTGDGDFLERAAFVELERGGRVDLVVWQDVDHVGLGLVAVAVLDAAVVRVAVADVEAHGGADPSVFGEGAVGVDVLRLDERARRLGRELGTDARFIVAEVDEVGLFQVLLGLDVGDTGSGVHTGRRGGVIAASASGRAQDEGEDEQGQGGDATHHYHLNSWVIR